MESARGTMTDKRRRRSRAETLAIVGAVSGAAFIGVFGGLANQMAASKDPVLGPPVMRALHAAIRNCPPPLEVAEGGHFLQEWGEPIAREAVRVL